MHARLACRPSTPQDHNPHQQPELTRSTTLRSLPPPQLGILTYDVLVGRPPFNAEAANTTVERILLEDPEFPDHVSDDAADFILCVSPGSGLRSCLLYCAALLNSVSSVRAVCGSAGAHVWVEVA